MTQPTPTLTCPKCGADMRGYERNSVTVDQCTSCRGIFLDRGELDRLIDAETGFYQAAAAPPAASNDVPSRSGHGGERHGGGHDRDDKRRRKGGFLSELFD